MQAKHAELIRAIIKRPGIYGAQNIGDIYLLLMGAKLFSLPKARAEISDFWVGFRVNKHTKCKEERDFHHLIRFYCVEGLNAIEYFGRLFEEYLRKHGC